MGRTIAISKFAADLARVGPMTRARVDARTHELALLAGRSPPHVTQSDYEQAKREVTGESDIDLQEAILDSVSALERRDSAPGSTGLPSSSATAVLP